MRTRLSRFTRGMGWLSTVCLLAGSLWGIAPEGRPAEAQGGPDGMSGSGTASAPYVITTRQQLVDLAAMEGDGGGTQGRYFVLGSDIDLSGEPWTPIPSFSGILDGRGHRITGMTVTPESAGGASALPEGPAAGLFGVLNDGGEIHNLGLTNVSADFTQAAVGGALAGIARQGSVIVHCYATGSVKASGGLLVSPFWRSIGGLVGIGGGTIRASYTLANVIVDAVVTNPGAVGGLVGYNQNSGQIDQSYSAEQTVYAGLSTPGNYVAVGGLVGENEGAVTDVYSNNHVQGDPVLDCVGGLVGRNLGQVQRGFADGQVAPQVPGSCVGGLVGHNAPGATVENGVWGIDDTGQSQGIGFGVGQVVGKTHDGMRGKDFFDPESYLAGWAPGWDESAVFSGNACYNVLFLLECVYG